MQTWLPIAFVLLQLPDLPLLAVAYGMQALNALYGGALGGVRTTTTSRDGAVVRTQRPDAFGASGARALGCMMSDLETVPSCFQVGGVDDRGRVVAMLSHRLRRWAVLYSPDAFVVAAFCDGVRMGRVEGNGDFLPRAAWERVAMRVAAVGARRTAREEGVSLELVGRAWNAFRTRFRVPSMLI